MPIPALVGAAGITAGGALLGGLLSDRSARASASKQRQMDIEFAKNQIQWKVADAKKAGIHPLYALGASGSYAPTNIIQGQSSTGSMLGAAASQISDMYLQSESQKAAAKQKAPLLAAQVNAANQSANRDHAQAALALSQSKRIEQEINAGPRVPDLYKPYRDNKTGKTVWLPNPEAGIEMPETLGALYWADAKALQASQHKRKPYDNKLRERRAQRRRAYQRKRAR